MMIRYTQAPGRAQRPIAADPFHCYMFEDGTVWTEFYREGTGYLLRFPGLADFEVAATGESVVAFPAPGTDQPTLEHLYVNQLLPLALSRQGKPAFHASVVTVPGGAVAFLGKTGMGKSTLAASFALEDASFLTDDALLIDERDEIWAMPSHPSLRLWDDSVEALVPRDLPAALPISYSNKARLLAGGSLRYSEEPVPLMAGFVLESNDPESIVIEALQGSECQMAWVSNSFLLDIEDQELLARHFDWTHRIADRVPTFRLDYPRDYGILHDVRHAVRRQAVSLGN